MTPLLVLSVFFNIIFIGAIAIRTNWGKHQVWLLTKSHSIMEPESLPKFKSGIGYRARYSNVTYTLNADGSVTSSHPDSAVVIAWMPVDFERCDIPRSNEFRPHHGFFKK